MSLFDSGIRPLIDEYLDKKQAEKRDYGEYWSASSAGYCQRKTIFERLGVPPTNPVDARKTRVFEAGHIFHEWAQRITKDASISIAQEVELQDEDLMIRGHFDDLVLVTTPKTQEFDHETQHLILYDYKTQNSRAFTFQKGRPISHYHKYQLGTYMLMLRSLSDNNIVKLFGEYNFKHSDIKSISEARILKLSKDDLRMDENELLWSDDLAKEIIDWWLELNAHWQNKTLPPCTCADHENGFMASEKWNPYFKYGEPCSLRYYQEWKAENKEIK